MKRACGTVVTYTPAGAADHQRVTLGEIARQLAALMQWEFGGEFDASARYRGRLYFVPGETLVADQARALRIRSESDLFGGVVPSPVVATKTIVHPLIRREARHPRGWSHLFAERVRDAVLPGFTAFTRQDAHHAGRKLLALGPVRLKAGHGIGGRDQLVISSTPELASALRRLPPSDLERYGVVVELDLVEATTYSIGQVRVDGLEATYWGTQTTTTDNAGAAAFGGSDVIIVRGGYEALASQPLDGDARSAIEQARLFDAATATFRGLFASRRNYDAVRGFDVQRRCRSGVLEQSWRLGGASGPEIAALAAFRADPSLRAVRARSVERYGSASPPPHAIVHFRGVDSDLGALTKYTTIEPYEPAR